MQGFADGITAARLHPGKDASRDTCYFNGPTTRMKIFTVVYLFYASGLNDADGTVELHRDIIAV
jgi:hypothetical protein